jgi:glycosyltransferase involved in cell wall biosynthesis
MRVLFALSGLHRVNRGAENAFISLAKELSKQEESVTLIGSGIPQESAQYRFIHAASVSRERFEGLPSLPVLRDECCYEEMTFIPALLRQYRPSDYDITVTCSYPFTNWLLRRPVLRGRRPRHIFVTQNGDWPAVAKQSGHRKWEYRFFGCDGLVCINPDFFDRNKHAWNCRLIPNGVDCDQFRPGLPRRRELGIPEDRFVVLMVSAFIPSKRIEIGIEAVSRISDAHLVVVGDGPLRNTIETAAAKSLPGRFTRLSIAMEKMPIVYQSSDVFLHCSKDESFGIVFVEAMACGLPIIAHEMPRVRWIVGNDEFLVDTNDCSAIAKGIEYARRSGLDRRQNRTEKAKKFSWVTIAQMYKEFFGNVLAGC